MATKRTQNRNLRTKRRRASRQRVDAPDEQRVRIRMYRPGLGECFLLTFPRLGVPFHMLIDCGVVPAANAVTAMKSIARDIEATTQGRLDVLVVTHRHWDHISGFLQAREVFRRMRVEQVWFGWTENPTDAQARRMEQRRFGGSGPIPSASAMDIVRSLGRAVWYWRGGQGPVALSGVLGARVFFLGPPHPRRTFPRLSARRPTGRALANVRSTSVTGFALKKPVPIRVSRPILDRPGKRTATQDRLTTTEGGGGSVWMFVRPFRRCGSTGRTPSMTPAS
jgi:hypothetical protein